MLIKAGLNNLSGNKLKIDKKPFVDSVVFPFSESELYNKIIKNEGAKDIYLLDSNNGNRWPIPPDSIFNVNTGGDLHIVADVLALLPKRFLETGLGSSGSGNSLFLDNQTLYIKTAAEPNPLPYSTAATIHGGYMSDGNRQVASIGNNEIVLIQNNGSTSVINHGLNDNVWAYVFDNFLYVRAVQSGQVKLYNTSDNNSFVTFFHSRLGMISRYIQSDSIIAEYNVTTGGVVNSRAYTRKSWTYYNNEFNALSLFYARTWGGVEPYYYDYVSNSIYRVDQWIANSTPAFICPSGLSFITAAYDGTHPNGDTFLVYESGIYKLRFNSGSWIFTQVYNAPINIPIGSYSSGNPIHAHAYNNVIYLRIDSTTRVYDLSNKSVSVLHY